VPGDATSDVRVDAGRLDSGHPDAGTPRETGSDAPVPSRDASAASDAPADAGSPPEAASEAAVTDAAGADAAANSCADGTPVSYTRTSCPGAPGPVPAALASAVTSGSLGEVVSLSGLDDSSLPSFPVRVCVPSDAPTLVFSDDPESPSSDGVLYADDLVAGNYRAYVYHTNAGTGLRKFPVVLLNQGATTVHATVTAKGIAGPSQDYVDVGKQALLRWFMSRGAGPIATVDVPAGQRVLLDGDLDAVHAGVNDLAHAVIDFSVDGPVKLSVVSVVSTEDATVVTSGLSLLPDDAVHARGSFPGADLEIESVGRVDGTGARHLRLGGGVTDTSLAGHDFVDNKSVTLDGNYGVSYALRVTFAAGAGSGLVLSPQGGAWGGAAIAGGAPSLVPASQDSVGTQTDAIVVGAYPAGATALVTLVSAGGSSLPVDLVTVPGP
jgi:hypothetical protein